MFIVPPQYITVAKLPCWMVIARTMSAKFKAFVFSVDYNYLIIIIPLCCCSVFCVLPTWLWINVY